MGDASGNFRDQDGRPVYRQSGLGDQGLIFRFEDESIYVYWNTSALEPQSDEDNWTVTVDGKETYEVPVAAICDRRVRLVDGATVTMADSEKNQAAYPQPKSQRKGLGFPMMRVVALMCLASGALLAAATGACAGKGGDEQTLLRGMLDRLDDGDILLGRETGRKLGTGGNWGQTRFLLPSHKPVGLQSGWRQHKKLREIIVVCLLFCCPLFCLLRITPPMTPFRLRRRPLRCRRCPPTSSLRADRLGR